VITIQQAERAYGAPASEWAGHCYEVATAVAPLIEGAVAVYGHYLGPVGKGTFFEATAVCGFVQHGWVVLPDGLVLDPTRWAFEGRKPYLYVGTDDDYDEGGSALRAALQGQAPQYEDDGDTFSITSSILDTAPWVWLESVLGLQDRFGDEGYEPGVVSQRQLFWVANLDPRLMGSDGEHAEAIYALLKQLDLTGFIPIDNKLMVERGRHRRKHA
jgi:hypothetical protein